MARRARSRGLAAQHRFVVLAVISCVLGVCTGAGVAHATTRDAAGIAVPPSPSFAMDASVRRSEPLRAWADAGSLADAALAEQVPADAGVATTPPPPMPPLFIIPSAGRLARVVLGLFALVALAIAAGHPRVAAFEKRFGLSMFAATGVPFLALGALARLPQVGIIDDDVVRNLRPLMEFGLGWIGYKVGSEFDIRELDRLPSGSGRLAAMQSATAFIMTAFGTIGTLWLIGRPLGSNIVRDGLILGACASVSGPSGARALEAIGIFSAEASRSVRKIVALDDVVPIAILAAVSAVFRPLEGGNWQLPPLGWVFVQIGMGAALGALTVGMQRAARNVNEELALTIGAVAFASGMATYVGFSPLAIGCVAGVVATNVMAGQENAEFFAKLRGLERPIFMVFFAVAGSLWEVRDWRGWVVIPLFVIARLLGKVFGARAGLTGEAARDTAHAFPSARHVSVALIPVSAVSIAVVISARQSYGDIPAWLESIAIMGAIAAELLFQVFLLAVHRNAPPSIVPGDGPPPVQGEPP